MVMLADYLASSATLVSLCFWLVFGVLAGLTIYYIDSDKETLGAGGTIFTGTIGSFIGGGLASYILGMPPNDFSLIAFTSALFGAYLFSVTERIILYRLKKLRARP